MLVPQFEADRRAIIITINSFGTELSKDDRAKLYPRCGKMAPDGLAALARADDYEQVKAVAEYYAEYAALFDGSGNNPGDKTLEDKFFEHEVWKQKAPIQFQIAALLLLILSIPGQIECFCIHSTIPLRCILCILEVEGARMPEYCLDR